VFLRISFSMALHIKLNQSPHIGRFNSVSLQLMSRRSFLSMGFCKICFGSVLKVMFLLNIVWATTLESDIEALILVKKGVDGDSIGTTTCLGSWDFSVDPCDFRSTRQFVCGIRCDVKTKEGKSRVTSFALDGVGYTGYLHPAIGNLTELTELDVAGNAFHGFIPESISRLGKLTILVFVKEPIGLVVIFCQQGISTISGLFWVFLGRDHCREYESFLICRA